MTSTTPKTRWQEITEIWHDNRWLYAVSGLLLGILATPFIEQFTDNLNDLIGNLVPEVIGIVFTVLILDRLAANRAREHYKLSLFRRVKSHSNDVALDAIDQILHDSLWAELHNHYKSNVEKIDLSHVQWGGVVLEKANMQNVNLRFAHLQNSQFSQTNFENANLSFGNLQGACLDGANLMNVNLRYALIQDASLYNARLENAYMVNASLKNTTLEFAHMEYANLTNAHLPNADLECARLMNANLHDTNLQGASLYDANLENANLQKTNLENAILLNANLQGVKYIETAYFNEKTLLPDAKPIGRDDKGKYTYNKYWTPETDMTRYTDPNHPDFWEPEWVKHQRNETDAKG